ncbi:hypothetical protein IG631_05786 [Alternaria alternata]|nr:hypothetical protein IG631_05786 [Alternaria alternata]
MSYSLLVLTLQRARVHDDALIAACVKRSGKHYEAKDCGMVRMRTSDRRPSGCHASDRLNFGLY